MQPLLLPCLRLVLSGAAGAQQLQFAHAPASSMAAESTGATAQQRSMHRQLLEQSAQQGAAWLMLGALRLHLVSTPAGPDPAAKPAQQRSHLLDLITRTDAELTVWFSSRVTSSRFRCSKHMLSWWDALCNPPSWSMYICPVIAEGPNAC